MQNSSGTGKAAALSEQSFAALAQDAGIDPIGYRPGERWRKEDRTRSHVVVRFDAADRPSLIFKQTHRPADISEFQKRVAAHELAEQALSGSTTLTVPRMLAADLERRCLLMNYFPGQTLLDLCRVTENHEPLMRRAGQWLSAFHERTFEQERVFQPKFMANHMLHLVDQIEAGERSVHSKRRFIELAHLVQDLQTVGTTPSKIAGKHGDMNIHNIMMSDDQVAGFDFSEAQTAPVGYDIARILLNYMQSVGDIDALPRGHVVPPSIWQAFFEGYSFVPPDDPSLSFLTRIQILTDWNRIGTRLSVKASIRFARLRKIARQAFA